MKKLIGAMLLLGLILVVASGQRTGFVLAAMPQTSGGHSVALSCTPPVADATHDVATSFNFKRSATTGGPYTQIGTASACAFSDANVSAGQKWFYVATAVNTAGESAQSNEVSATISTFPPAPPTSLVGVPK